MNDFDFAKASAVVSVLFASCFAATGASAQDCYRHAECDGQDLCIGNICTASEEPLETCEVEDDCPGNHPGCDDGFCKTEGVYCENPAGHCYSENTWSSCSCADGAGSDGQGDPPDPLLTDAELYEQCMEILVMDCGEDAPDISDECTEDQLESCTGYQDYLNGLYEACDEETEEWGFMQMAQCCEDMAEGEDEFMDTYDCVMNLDLAECEQLDDCWGDGGEGGSDELGDNEDGGADEADDAPSPGGGCSFARIPPEGHALLSLLVSAIF